MTNVNFIRSPHAIERFGAQTGWPATESELKVMFGLGPKAKWPDAGMPIQVIQGITVFVLSKQEAEDHKVFHRARGVCPSCRITMSAGRLKQHVCKEDKVRLT